MQLGISLQDRWYTQFSRKFWKTNTIMGYFFLQGGGGGVLYGFIKDCLDGFSTPSQNKPRSIKYNRPKIVYSPPPPTRRERTLFSRGQNTVETHFLIWPNISIIILLSEFPCQSLDSQNVSLTQDADIPSCKRPRKREKRGIPFLNSPQSARHSTKCDLVLTA